MKNMKKKEEEEIRILTVAKNALENNRINDNNIMPYRNNSNYWE